MFLVLHFHQVSKRKDIKMGYFMLINLKTDFSFNVSLKDKHNMSYMQVLFHLI